MDTRYQAALLMIDVHNFVIKTAVTDGRVNEEQLQITHHQRQQPSNASNATEKASEGIREVVSFQPTWKVLGTWHSI